MGLSMLFSLSSETKRSDESRGEEGREGGRREKLKEAELYSWAKLSKR